MLTTHPWKIDKINVHDISLAVIVIWFNTFVCRVIFVLLGLLFQGVANQPQYIPSCRISEVWYYRMCIDLSSVAFILTTVSAIIKISVQRLNFLCILTINLWTNLFLFVINSWTVFRWFSVAFLAIKRSRYSSRSWRIPVQQIKVECDVLPTSCWWGIRIPDWPLSDFYSKNDLKQSTHFKKMPFLPCNGIEASNNFKVCSSTETSQTSSGVTY